MTTAGPRYPGTIATDSSTGTIDWTNPSNIGADDAAYATVTPGTPGTHYTYYLNATNLGFSVSGTINGITVEIDRYSANNLAARFGIDALLYLIKGGTIQTSGSNKANTTNKWPTTPTVATYGGSSDLWGNTWSATDINSSGFGVAFGANCTRAAQSNTIYVDFIRVTVYYTVGGNNYTQVVSGAVSPDGTLVRLTKKTLSGTITTDSTLLRSTQKFLAGSLSPSGSRARLILKALSGSISPSSVVASFKTRIITLAGALSPSGALSRRTTRQLGGSVAPSSSVARRTTRQLGGSVAPSSSVARRTTRQLAGALSPSGAFSYVRATIVILAGALSPSGSLNRTTAKKPSGSVSPSGAMKRITTKKPSGSLSPSGAMKRITTKKPSGSLSPSGSLKKSIKKLLSGSVSPSGFLLALTQILIGNPNPPTVPYGVLSYQLPAAPRSSGMLSGNLPRSVMCQVQFAGANIGLPRPVTGHSRLAGLLPEAPRTAIILATSIPAAPGVGASQAANLPKPPVTQGVIKL